MRCLIVSLASGYSELMELGVEFKCVTWDPRYLWREWSPDGLLHCGAVASRIKGHLNTHIVYV